MLNYRAHIEAWLAHSPDTERLVAYLDYFGCNEIEHEPFYPEFLQKVKVFNYLRPLPLIKSYNFELLMRLIRASYLINPWIRFNKSQEIYPEFGFEVFTGEEVQQRVISGLSSLAIDNLFHTLITGMMDSYLKRLEEDPEWELIFIHRRFAIESWNVEADLVRARIKRNEIVWGQGDGIL